MNNYSSKTLLATFQSSFHQNTKPQPALTVWMLSSWCFGEKETPAASASHIVLINASVFVFLATGTHRVEPAGSSFRVSSQLRSAPLCGLLPNSSKVIMVCCIRMKQMHYILTAPAAVFHKSWHLWAGGSKWSDTFPETVRRKQFRVADLNDLCFVKFWLSTAHLSGWWMVTVWHLELTELTSK